VNSKSLIGRPPAFVYRKDKGQKNSELHCEDVPLTQLAKKLDTPLYVYSANTIRQRLKAFDQAFHTVPHTVCYSVKANSNLSILRLLAKLGCGFDVVSGGELERVLQADRRAVKKVVFSGVGKTADEMRAALKADILLFNVESESELALLAESAARLKKTARIALRVNPDVSAETHPYISTGLHKHKFGVPIQQAQGLYSLAAKSKFLQTAGVSVHIGSQIIDVSPFAAAMERVAELIRGLRSDGHQIRYVDAGGGLGIAYRDENLPELSEQAAAYAAALTAPLKKLKLHLLLEPGRSIVAPAGTLLTRVLYRKSNNGKKFLIVDAAMNDLIRPSLYQAYHEIVPVNAATTSTEITDVVGPICETGDFFARDRELAVVQEGELLALLDAGAYGSVLSSNYNTRPRPAEILIDKTKVQVIRRRETTQDLLRAEKR
jgi:diaminopimelate decarboxylase